jgi:hypothetical protein
MIRCAVWLESHSRKLPSLLPMLFPIAASLELPPAVA